VSWLEIIAASSTDKKPHVNVMAESSGTHKVLRIYVKHYSEHRPHRALGIEAPDRRAGVTVVGEDGQGRGAAA